MRRWVWMLLLPLLLLVGCGGKREEMAQPVGFYYVYADARNGAYADASGALAREICDLGPQKLPADEILRRYLLGPEDPAYVSPFPAGTTVEYVSLRNQTLTVGLSEEAASLQGIDSTLAAACLVATMTQFADIDAVELQIGGTSMWESELTDSDFLLFDDTATSDAVTMKLYFGSADGRYLTDETRNRSFQSEDEIPRYILQQLVEGPQAEDGIRLLPEGTRILDVQVRDGVCTVNFSESFLWYQPATHLDARRAVLSVVNSLTELPEVACVRFLCGGNPVSYYMGMDLTEPIYRDESAFGTGLEQKDFADVTLYVPCGKQDRLAAVPMVLEQASGRTAEAGLLNALLSMETINGYTNPFPDGTMLLDVEVKNKRCTVTFNAAFAMCDSDPAQARKAVRSVVASLCTLDTVEQVSIVIHNGKLSSVDLAAPLTVEPAWLLP